MLFFKKKKKTYETFSSTMSKTIKSNADASFNSIDTSKPIYNKKTGMLTKEGFRQRAISFGYTAKMSFDDSYDSDCVTGESKLGPEVLQYSFYEFSDSEAASEMFKQEMTSSTLKDLVSDYKVVLNSSTSDRESYGAKFTGGGRHGSTYITRVKNTVLSAVSFTNPVETLSFMKRFEY